MEELQLPSLDHSDAVMPLTSPFTNWGKFTSFH